MTSCSSFISWFCFVDLQTLVWPAGAEGPVPGQEAKVHPGASLVTQTQVRWAVQLQVLEKHRRWIHQPEQETVLVLSRSSQQTTRWRPAHPYSPDLRRCLQGQSELIATTEAVFTA